MRGRRRLPLGDLTTEAGQTRAAQWPSARPGGTCTVTLGRVDPVGGRVEGTFSARLPRSEVNTDAPEVVEILEGRFNAVRGPDELVDDRN